MPPMYEKTRLTTVGTVYIIKPNIGKNQILADNWFNGGENDASDTYGMSGTVAV